MNNGESVEVQYTIKAGSKAECEQQLRKKYGDNGYKIDSFETSLTSGFWGFFQKEYTKATYHIIPEPAYAKKTPVAPEPKDLHPEYTDIHSNAKDILSIYQTLNEKNRDDFSQKKQQTLANMQLSQITSKLDELSKNLQQVNKAVNEGVPVSQIEHPTLTKIQDLLKQNEFTEPYIKQILERIKGKFSLEQLEDFDKVESCVIDWIGEGIHVASPLAYRPPHVIIIVGPTGVGKTTTLAKLAASIILPSRKEKSNGSDVAEPVVKLITTDYMRVGALNMLETYGNIMRMTVDKAESSADVKNLFKRYEKLGVDYILIDTSGLSPKDYKNIGDMRAILDVPSMNADIYLAIAASTKASDVENIMRNYESFNFRSVIITKYDETSSYGNILSVLSQKDKEISLITTGQDVTSFIERANPARFLLDLNGFAKDEEHIKKKFKFNEDDVKKHLVD